MDDLLNILNEQQQKAVAAPAGPSLVLAGPGSGKTRVLTYRIAYLVGALNVPAWNILAVTFTNKAAREMGDRVNKILGSNADGIWLGTFHSVCGRILRREAELLPVTRDFVIFDQDDQTTLLKEIIKENNLDEKLHRPASYLNEISRAKNELIMPDDFPITNFREEQTKRHYSIYQERLIKTMPWILTICSSIPQLLTYPVVRETAHKFEHILVDEFRIPTWRNMPSLKSGQSPSNLYVVGETKAFIAGAEIIATLNALKDFKNAKSICLKPLPFKPKHSRQCHGGYRSQPKPHPSNLKLFATVRKNHHDCC